MANKSDKPAVSILIGACIAAIIIFHSVWATYTWNMDSTMFYVADFAAIVAFVCFSVIAYRQSEDPNFDKYRWFLLLTAVAICVWVGTWSSQRMVDISEGIR